MFPTELDGQIFRSFTLPDVSYSETVMNPDMHKEQSNMSEGIPTSNEAEKKERSADASPYNQPEESQCDANATVTSKSDMTEANVGAPLGSKSKLKQNATSRQMPAENIFNIILARLVSCQTYDSLQELGSCLEIPDLNAMSRPSVRSPGRSRSFKPIPR